MILDQSAGLAAHRARLNGAATLAVLPFKGEYGYRRMLNASQWRARYRGIVQNYKRVSYRLHNPFVVL